MSISLTALPALVIPGAEFPAWAPWVFAAMGLTTIAVLVYQAVRYFRDNPGDDNRRTNRGSPDEPGNPSRDPRDGGS